MSKHQIYTNEQPSPKVFTIKFIITLIVIVLSVLVLLNFILQISLVFGASMEPTLETGNIVLGNRLARKYERMDIVTARINGVLLIKRVIGLPGETIQIKEGYIYVNGEKIEDITEEAMSMANVYYGVKELTLGEDEYFLVGDNRDKSSDSRAKEIGPVKEEDINAKVILFLIPFKTP